MKKSCILLVLMFCLWCLESQASQFENESSSVEVPENSSSIMPKYGNWCGPAYPKNIETAGNPIDALDTACQEHDFCYVKKGYMSCECDNEFNEKVVSGLMEDRFGGTEKILARSFLVYFKGSPCVGDPKDKVALSRAVHGIAKKVGSKATELVERIPFVDE